MKNIFFCLSVFLCFFQIKAFGDEIPSGFHLDRQNTSGDKETSCFFIKMKKETKGRVCRSGNEKFLESFILKVESTEDLENFHLDKPAYVALGALGDYSELKILDSSHPEILKTQIGCKTNEKRREKIDTECVVVVRLKEGKPFLFANVYINDVPSNKRHIKEGDLNAVLNWIYHVNF